MTDIRTRLILEAQGTKDAEKQIASLRKEQSRLEKSIKDSTDAEGNATAVTAKLVRQYQDLIDSEKELRNLVDSTNDAYGQRSKALRGNDRFDRTSEGVSALGDLESNTRTLGSAAAFAGSKDSEKIFAGVAELAAVGEALPRLAESARNVVPALTEAATSLGPLGIAMAGLGVAAVALFNEFSKIDKKNAERGKNAIDTFAEIQRGIADGTLTSEDARKKIEELNRTRNVEQTILDANQKTYDNYIETNKELELAVRAVGEEEQTYADAVKNSEKAVTNAEDSTDGWTAALEAGAFAANDAAAAERALAEERLTDAAFAGQQARLAAEAADMTREQIQAQQDRLELDRIALQTELDALQAQEELSQAEQDRIAEIKESLDRLSESNTTLENAKAGAQSEAELSEARKESTAVTKEVTKAETDKKEADREAAKAAEEAARQAEKAAQAQRQYSEAIDNANIKAEQASEDIGRDLADSLVDNRIDTLDALQDAQDSFNRDEIARTRDQSREIAKIQKDGDKAERDAIRDRNFLQLADAREQEKEDIEERVDAFKAEGDDRLMEAQQQRQDITREAERTTRDLQREAQQQRRDAQIALNREIQAAERKLNIEQQTLNQSVNLFQQWAQNILGVQQQMLQNVNGQGGGSTQITSVAGIENIFNQQTFGV